MFDIGHMNFFNIDHCGLYRVGLDKTHGCEVEETFKLISEWVKDRPLASTIPWDPKETKTNKSKCYCKDIHHNKETNDYFIVLWKSDTDSAGTLWGAQEDHETGNNDVIKYTNEYKGKKVIWGRPCYYWVIPEYNTVVSIKFDHSVCDAQLFEDYIFSCINNRVKHKNRKKEYTAKGFVRISYIDDEGNSRYQFRFGMSLKSLNTSSVELQKLSEKVTHIVRREIILVDSKDERAEWVKKFTDIVPFVAAKPKSKQRKIEVKAEAKPSASEIKEIIEKNAKDNRKTNDWNNVGFATENGITWVDKYRLRDVLSVSGNKDRIFSALELCENIMKDRTRYITPIKRAKNNKDYTLKESSKAEM